MININKKNKEINNLIKHSNYSTKISLFFSTKQISEEYDSYEQNYTYTSLNPITIKAFVREISAKSLVWRQIGTQETGAKEILCEDKYEDWFKNCNRIVIDGDDYEVFREHVGNRVMIQQRPFKTILVVVRKK